MVNTLGFTYIILILVQFTIALSAINPFLRVLRGDALPLDFMRVACAGVAVSAALGIIFNIRAGVITLYDPWDWSVLFIATVRILANLFVLKVIWTRREQIQRVLK